MLVLRVGDPHIKVSNLADSEKLLGFVLEQAVVNNVDRVEILGDLFHNHAILRVEVLQFWEKWIRALCSKTKDVIVLEGNHDQTGNYENNVYSAVSVFKQFGLENLTIVDDRTQDGVFGYLPYIHHEEEFIESANQLADLGCKVLICHATFQGSVFENGFYAPAGFDMNKVNIPLIISGHIHKRQRFGKVIYPGTGKWDIKSDANEQKGLWLVKHNEDGSIATERFIDTSQVCTPIFSLEWKEGDEQPEIPAGRVSLELVGSSEWIKKQKSALKGKCSLSSKFTDKGRSDSRKVGNGLLDFVSSNFDPIAGVSREQIVAYLKEKGLV